MLASMFGTTAEIRETILRAGWSVSHLVEGALKVHERTFDVTNVGAVRGGLYAFLVVTREPLGDNEAFLSLADSPRVESRRSGGAQVRLQVYDGERGREELEALLPKLQAGWFDEALRTVAARGWNVDRQRSDERVGYDEPAWSIRAASPTEDLEIGASAFGVDGGKGLVMDKGKVSLETSGARYHASIVSTTEAARFAEALGLAV